MVFKSQLVSLNQELLFQNEEKAKRAAELVIANKELLFQNAEKDKRAAELVIANAELLFQNEEKAKRAAELVIANAELLFQNAEKDKRSAELVIANEELLFQNEEKAKRAAELVIANKELLFQDEEKAKRAAELVIANKELLFQNAEKDKRAAELVIANKELLFQNEEKAKRAAELVVANEEISIQLKEIEGAFWRIVEVATLLTEMRDPYTSGHERRVAEIAVAIGAELGCDARQQEGLRVASYLHDIGKITVPSEILTKPGKLKPAEYALIKTHAQDGYEVLKNVNFPWQIAEIVLQHHERHDGTGYPQGLKGEDILFEAKIIAAADVVEAMSSHRPYRAALGIGAALTEIELGSGTKFDPTVVRACLRLFRERGYSVPA